MSATPTRKGPSGIRASIYKDSGRDYSNGGVSSFTDEVTVILPEGGPFEPTEAAPAVEFVRRTIGGRAAHYFRPVEGPEGHERMVGPMAGGTYLGSSDSRFSDLTGMYGAVPFHDRYETTEQYRALSN